MDKIDDIRKKLAEAKQLAELGKVVPGAEPYIDEGKDIITMADTGLTIFQKIKGMFKKRKK